MSFRFEWNAYADQPHNVAPRSERMRHHWKRAGSYLALAAANLKRAVPILSRYREYRKAMFMKSVSIRDGIACSVSLREDGRNDEVVRLLKETGVRETLVRVASWEKEKIGDFERFIRILRQEGFQVSVSLLQQRDDVLSPGKWEAFLSEVFERLGPFADCFEIGHAWNRTKWGVWDFTEYLRLAVPAFSQASRRGVRLAGPAVIDFEFHLYPVTLPGLPFHKVTSLLYVDRVGAPENKQCGWNTVQKVALLKAVVDCCATGSRDLWITEVNWPLKGTEPWSPVSGKPNVTEEEQADYLARYYVLCLAGGLVEKVFWWQLVAPGYGLVDSREEPWRKRPGFEALRTLARELEGSEFIGKVRGSAAEIFLFRRDGREFVIGWAPRAPAEHVFDRRIAGVRGRDGRERPFEQGRIRLDGSPRYVYFD
ncbi:MAG: hypothetical protein PHX45_05990 [Acidobacteriota bacterium]|nr:hypothetical protein [Acidobacteriota bacterium]